MVTRRSFLKKLALGLTYILFHKTSAAQDASTSDRPRAFRWRVPKVHLKTVKDELRFEGEIEPEKDAKGLLLVYVFIGIAMLPSLAKAVLALRRGMVYGGVVIDSRGEEIEIDTDKSLPSSVIVVITPEGTQLYEHNEISSTEELVKILSKGV